MTARKAEVAATTGSTAVATRPEGLPLEISSGTIRIPKLKKGEPLSEAVKNGDAAFLDLYTTTGKDDANPKVVGKADPKQGTKAGQEIRLHVLAVQEGRSDTVDGDLVSYNLHGGRWLDREGEEAGPNAYVTQTYTVCLPDVDRDTPFSLMLYKSSMGAARNINTALVEHVQKGGSPFELAFELTVELKKSTKFSWGAFRARAMEARAEDVATASELAHRVAAILPRTPVDAAPVDRPEI